MLAMSGTDAPAGIWDRIVGEIDGEARHLAPGRETLTPIFERRQARERERRSVGVGWVGVAAAVAATLIAVLSVQVVRQNDRIDRLDVAMSGDSVRRAAENAATEPGSRTVRLTSDNGAELADIVLRPNGTGYFVSKGLEAAPGGDVYQLWALVGDPDQPEAISAGVLGQDPRVASFRFSSPVNGFAVTQERAPGVVSSLQQPKLSGLVPA
jgi:hypothetical protein